MMLKVFLELRKSEKVSPYVKVVQNSKDIVSLRVLQEPESIRYTGIVRVYYLNEFC